MFKIFIFLLFFVFIACDSDDSASGKESEGCKSDNSCDKNLYCNLKTKSCEVCSVDTGIISFCEDGLCTVSEGDFCMGCQELEGVYCNEDELPYHKIYLKTYKIDQYEVTAASFKECVKDGGCKKKHIYLDESVNCNYNVAGKENYPMNCINWLGAEEYCKWKGKRLPTEAEWEKAARGIDGRMYPWNSSTFGCKFSVVDPDEFINDNEGCALNKTWSIGLLATGISPYGLYDMSGNVMEWVSDYYSNTYYTDIQNIEMPDDSEAKNTDNPQGPETGKSRVLRGGGWKTFSKDVYTFRRTRYVPEFGHDDYGFRCVEDIPKK